ncbi:MAG: hypothetical protein ACRD19_06910 [Terriglobia bacterium]
MESKSQQAQLDEQLRQILFAVTEVIFQVIAVLLQQIEILVFDLPAGVPVAAATSNSRTQAGASTMLLDHIEAAGGEERACRILLAGA